MERPVTVLVADDHVGVAAAVTNWLARQYRCEPPVNSPRQLRDALASWAVREGWREGTLVVLLDIQFADDQPDGLELLEELCPRFPEARYVMYSAFASRLFVHRALELGALGFVDKLCGLTELNRAIEAAAQGRKAILTDRDVGGGRGLHPADSSPSTDPSAGARAPPSGAQAPRNRGHSGDHTLGRRGGYHAIAEELRPDPRHESGLARLHRMRGSGVGAARYGVT